MNLEPEVKDYPDQVATPKFHARKAAKAAIYAEVEAFIKRITALQKEMKENL